MHSRIFLLLLIQEDAIDSIKCISSSTSFFTVKSIYDNFVKYMDGGNKLILTQNNFTYKYRIEISCAHYVGPEILDKQIKNLTLWLWYAASENGIIVKPSVITDDIPDNDTSENYFKDSLRIRKYTAQMWEIEMRKEILIQHLLTTKYFHMWQTDKNMFRMCYKCKNNVFPNELYLYKYTDNMQLNFCQTCGRNEEKVIYNMVLSEAKNSSPPSQIPQEPELMKGCVFLCNTESKTGSYFGLNETKIHFQVNKHPAIYYELEEELFKRYTREKMKKSAEGHFSRIFQYDFNQLAYSYLMQGKQ